MKAERKSKQRIAGLLLHMDEGSLQRISQMQTDQMKRTVH